VPGYLDETQNGPAPEMCYPMPRFLANKALSKYYQKSGQKRGIHGSPPLLLNLLMYTAHLFVEIKVIITFIIHWRPVISM